MSYTVDYGDLKTLMGGFNSVLAGWNEAVAAMMAKVGALEASRNISGNNADRMKDYLGTSYMCAKDLITAMLELFQENYLLYTEDYYRQVDGAGDTHIGEAELNERRASLQLQKSQMQQIAISAEAAVDKVKDLIQLPSLDISDADAELGSIITAMDGLNDAINAVESAHSSADIARIDALINNAKAYLVELCGQNKEFKTSFSQESFMSLSSVPGVIKAIHDASAQIEAQEQNVINATGIAVGAVVGSSVFYKFLGNELNTSGSDHSWDTPLGTINNMYYKASVENYAQWDVKKGDVGVGVKGTLSSSQLQTENEGQIGNAKGGYEFKVGTIQAEGKATLNIIHSGEINPTLEAGVKVEAHGIDGKFEGSYGNEQIDIHANGSGTVGKAEAEAKLSISKDGVGGKAKVGVAALSGKATVGFKFFGAKIDASVEGEAGALGAGAEFGVSDSSFEVGGKLSVLAGLGLKIKVSW